ncbi:MAG: potassium channel family protein, partial [Candidatus Methylomirabilales bacterium]
GFIDAFYMTSLALTTVGFTPQPPFGPGEKVFTVSISILGAGAFFAFLTLFAVALAEGLFTISARRRKMERRIRAMREHFIVCAYGRVGRTTCRELETEEVPFVVVDSKEELEEQMELDEVAYIIGDPTSEAVLRRAGMERARGLVCAVDSDAQNVYITLTARSLNSQIFIVARAGEPESVDQLFRAGANRVVSPYVTSGRHMALLALRPRVVDYLDLAGLGDRKVRLDELLVDEGSPLVGRTLEDVCAGAVPLVIRRASGDLMPNPSSAAPLGAGDLIILLGEPRTLRPVEGG